MSRSVWLGLALLLVVALGLWRLLRDDAVAPAAPRVDQAGATSEPPEQDLPEESRDEPATPVPLAILDEETDAAVEPPLPPLDLRVRHASGEPAPAALVALVRRVHQGGGATDALARAVTDEHGRVTLDPFDGRVDVWIGGATWEPFRQRLAEGSGAHDVDLPPGDVLGGRVLVDGRVPDGPVLLHLVPEPPVSWGSPYLADRDLPGQLGWEGQRNPFVTSAGGRFLVSALPAGWEGQIVCPPGLNFGAPWEYGKAVRAPDRNLLLELVRLPRILGRFVDESGAPVPRAPCAYRLEEAETSGVKASSGGILEADDHGRFEFPMRDAGEVRLTLDARDPAGLLSYAASFGPFDGTADQDLGDLVLRPTRAVTLVVAEPDGKPVQGALACLDATALHQDWSAPTDEQGRCTLVVPHDVDVLAVLSPRHSTTRITVGRPPPAELPVTLQPCACLTISVVTTSGGRPQGDLSIRVMAQELLFEESGPGFGPPPMRMRVSPLLDESAASPVSRRRDTGLPEPGHLELAITDEPVFLSCLQPGVPFVVEVVDHWVFAVDRNDVVLLPGELHDLVLRVPETAIDVTLALRDEQGAPVAGAQVQVRDRDFSNGPVPATLVTDGQGSVLLPRVFATRLDVRVRAEGFPVLDLHDVPVPSGGAWELVLRR